MHDPMVRERGKLDEARFSRRRLFFPGHWTVQSFRKSRLLRNYSLCRSDAALPDRSFVKRYFACVGGTMKSRQETRVSLANNKVSQ